MNQDKSYVAITVSVCPICQAEKDTGVALHTKLKDVLPPKVLDGFAICDECTKLLNNGANVAIVEVDTTNSKPPYTPHTAKLTGRYCIVPKIELPKIFKADVVASWGGDIQFLYCGKDLMSFLFDSASNESQPS